MLEFLYNHDPFEVSCYSEGYRGPMFTDGFLEAVERNGGFEGMIDYEPEDESDEPEDASDELDDAEYGFLETLAVVENAVGFAAGIDFEPKGK